MGNHPVRFLGEGAAARPLPYPTATLSPTDLRADARAYTKLQEGSAIVSRGKYVAVAWEKPKEKKQAQRPQYKTCKFATEAIIADGDGKGEHLLSTYRAFFYFACLWITLRRCI